jgi:hypothetical protein
MTEVSAQVTDGGSINFNYDFGTDLKSAIAIFGEEIVWSFALRGLTIAAQSYARGLIKSGKSKDECLAAIAAWKPGAPKATKSKEDRVRELLSKMTPEDRAKLQAELLADQPAKKSKVA